MQHLYTMINTIGNTSNKTNIFRKVAQIGMIQLLLIFVDSTLHARPEVSIVRFFNNYKAFTSKCMRIP